MPRAWSARSKRPSAVPPKATMIPSGDNEPSSPVLTDASAAASLAPESPPTGGSGRRRRTKLAVWAERYGLVGAWLVMSLAFAIARPSTFATFTNLRIILSSQTVIFALTMALVWGLSAGEYDLSTAAVAGFTGILVVWLTAVHGWPLIPALVVAVAASATVGLINAYMVVRVNVPSLVMTLGMGTLLTGVAIGIGGPLPLTFKNQGWSNTADSSILGLPVVFYIALATAFALYYTLEHTPLGRYVRFVGANRDVSRLAGIRVTRVRVLAFMGSCLISAIAGLLLVFQQGSTDTTASNDYLLPAFAASFLGATAISPGRFNVWGGFIAVYFLVTGTVGLQLLGLSGWITQAFYGASLIVGVAVSQLLSRGVKSPLNS